MNRLQFDKHRARCQPALARPQKHHRRFTGQLEEILEGVAVLNAAAGNPVRLTGGSEKVHPPKVLVDGRAENSSCRSRLLRPRFRDENVHFADSNLP